MAGIKNDVLYGKNADFTTAASTGGAEGNGLITDGQLWIGATTTNAGGTHINVGTLTSPDGSINIGFNSPDITIETSGLADLHVARFIVSAGGSSDGANYTSIASAIADAAGTGNNETIFIQPGTYTENLTLQPGINLTAFTCDSTTPNVTISGTLTYTQAGSVSISGINLQTNSAACLAITGSAASVVKLTDCYFNCTNNTGITFSSSSSSASLVLQNCNGDLGTTGIGLFTNTSAGSFRINGGIFTNSGGSTTASSAGNGANVLCTYCTFAFPFSTSGTGNIFFSYCNVNTSTENATCFTTAGTGNSVIEYSDFISGTASALSIGSGTAVLALAPCQVSSTNTNAITGAGTFNFSNIYYNNNNFVNVTSYNGYAGSGWQLIKSVPISNDANIVLNNLSLFRIYAIVFNNVLLQTNAQRFYMDVSDDNGSSYASSGYQTGVNYHAYNSTTYTNVNSTSLAVLTSNVTNGGALQGIIFATPGTGNYYGTFNYFSTDTTTQVSAECGGGCPVVFNAFRFQATMGNLTSGRITIYGIPN